MAANPKPGKLHTQSLKREDVLARGPSHASVEHTLEVQAAPTQNTWEEAENEVLAKRPELWRRLADL